MVMRLDFDRGVGPRRRGPANHQGDVKAQSLHFLGDMNHFIEGRGNEARQTNDVYLMGFSGF